MIKEIKIEYCPANQKYDGFIDKEWTGKWYTMKECLKNMLRRVERDEEEEVDPEFMRNV